MRRSELLSYEHGNGSGAVERLSLGQRKQLLRLQAPLEIAPQLIAVSIYAREVDGTTFERGTYIDLVAHVSWGNGRGGGTAEVDIARSTVFTVSAASTLTVEVEYARHPATSTQRADPPPMFIEGCAAYGTPAALTALRSHRLGQLGPKQPSDMRRVPPYARSFTVLCANPGVREDPLVEFYQDNHGGPRLYAVLQPDARTDPVVNGAEFYSVSSNSQEGDDFVIVWFLSL